MKLSKIGVGVKESYQELVHKVTWPTRKELTNSAVVVMVATLLIAIFIFLVDQLFELLMSNVYTLVK